ncbi:hypothetical protein K435DRAFT_44420 [Dendrothele bispora CBS 962.96]|uniref:ARM repeat-containing protein n=1 Tax=Dendrothele bispora (strain CBS 962.96) TaxID=1314807 RepID=A0A4S8MT69_DENBC|nr:hypothetical protein K435DRAFT_44420 [Dendrothele bispora CBS 962.96]
MGVLDISALSIDDAGPGRFDHLFPSDSKTDDHYLQKLKTYAQSLPYSIEPHSKMMEMLDFILRRIVQCVEAKDLDVGLMQWDSMLTYWTMLKYPIPKEKRVAIAKIYFYLSITPGMPTQVVATCADGFKVLTQSKKKMTIDDLRLPWKPIYKILSEDLFLNRRQFEYTQISWVMGYIADNARKFFHPAAINEMLSTFVPLVNGQLDTILSSQYYLLTFLPLTHPQTYLPMLFRMWESFNSYIYDERFLDFLAKIAEMHVAPEVSDPRKIAQLPDDAKSEDEDRPAWSEEIPGDDAVWSGIYKDVGIFTEHEWHLLMCKCLASMQIPLADAGSLTTGPSADSQAGFEIGRLPKPTWRIVSLARIIVYSMSPDGMPTPASNAPTPLFTPLPSGMNTPAVQTSALSDYLSAPLAKASHLKHRTYLGGSKALDSLARLIASVEGFFHPSNSGGWTADLSAFLKFLVYHFNKRWHEEQQPDCKTPRNRRLTKLMRRELVKSLRTVVLLAMFSESDTVVSNIQSCLKSMSVMEPGLVLPPLLERAMPSLEALVETQRTTAVIKALSSIAPAIVSRQNHYPGAKHLVEILELLIPGIDLNDPSKTLCTAAFLSEISQYIKFGDLTGAPMGDAVDLVPKEPSTPGPGLTAQMLGLSPFDETYDENEPKLSKEEEDAILKSTTASFADWIANFIRRVIRLLENLPEEGPNGTAGGATEVSVVDAVAGACNQICVHLSPSLYDLVLNMVYDYASTNVRPNGLRAIHQLVECVANADPEKTLARFFPFCSNIIRHELENGASSERTTSSSTLIPSDATLYWNLAILRGTVYNDGKAVLKYKNEFLSLLKLLHAKTFSKRGFSWTGKLLSSMLLTLTHTYPLENRFVNPDEWDSEEFRWNHHRHWGKLYSPDEIKISWHVPDDEEIDFTLQIFRELVEPTLTTLNDLLKPGVVRDAIWRNDFCRHLTLVRNAFSGIPTLVKLYASADQISASAKTSDILNEIPEMIAVLENLHAGFCLTDPADHRYRYILSLRQKFGEFLYDASVSLREQGEENTVDAVHILLRSIRTYMMDYGDSRDSYFVNEDHYISAKNVARHYARQRVWPRAVYIRRARFYHSARLRWNSIDRIRGPLEDKIIDEVASWSMWHYPLIRISSQSLMESLCSVYDGIRRRTLSLFYKALQPGDDDRMKGALWSLNLPAFGKYAAAEPTLCTEIFQNLLRCQHNEKPSIQDAVQIVSETCIAVFVEPNNLFYRISTPKLDEALAQFKTSLGFGAEDVAVIDKCRENVTERVRLQEEASDHTVATIMEIATSSKIHWRYLILAVRLLRTLIRKDKPISPEMLSFFLDSTHDSNPSVRYYAQRAIMKTGRNIKLRTFCKNPIDLFEGRNHNPLKRHVTVCDPSHSLAQKLENDFRVPIDPKMTSEDAVFLDKAPGWIWDETITMYKPPLWPTSPEWDPQSQVAVAKARKIIQTPSFWKEVCKYMAEETHEVSMTQDVVCVVKSIFQLLEDDPFESVKSILEGLIKAKEVDKQRAAAEIVAGIIGGSKNWPRSKQEKFWKWFSPYLKSIFGQNLKSDTVGVWTSFLEYTFYNKDPRRVQPLFDHIINTFNSLDFNTELSFDAVKILSLFRACYEELGWRFSAWIDDTVKRCWLEIHSDHDDVRAYIAEIFAFADKIKWRPRPSIPTVEVFVKECRVLPTDFDLMGVRGWYHKARVEELVEKFKEWRAERQPGPTAFQSKYDRVGVCVCRWLFQSVHDTNALCCFDYIIPLMPELFRFTEVNDNDELANRAHNLLVRMCGLTLTPALISPILDAILNAQSVSSWKVRLKALPLVQIFYFRQLPLISDAKIVYILEVLCKSLDDEVLEVSQMAATTLSGVIRLSPRSSVLTLKNRFVRLVKSTSIPDRKDPTYNKCIRRRHAAILGITALIQSFPYTVEKWMPELLTNVLAEYVSDPIPISTAVKNCAASFKKTHTDTWHEDQKRFDDNQLGVLSTLLTGSSYYA